MDRTLPEGLGWSVGTERPGVGVSPKFVEDIIKNGVKSNAGGGRIRYKSGDLEVITESADKIIITIKRVRD